jgi:hypothetical protein
LARNGRKRKEKVGIFIIGSWGTDWSGWRLGDRLEWRYKEGWERRHVQGRGTGGLEERGTAERRERKLT